MAVFKTRCIPEGLKEGACTMQTTVQPNDRLYFLDNLRIYLTILVIFHHAALAYGGGRSWYVGRDPMTDEISPIFLTLFDIINQSYFMSAFFLLAGYFTPLSLVWLRWCWGRKMEIGDFGLPPIYRSIALVEFVFFCYFSRNRVSVFQI